MMRLRLVPALALVLAGCAAPRPSPEPEIRLADDVVIRRVAPGVWMHTTIGDAGGVRYPGNGLLIETDSGSIVVDPGWNDRHGEVLLRWARETGRPIRTAIATHAHYDRTGAVGAMRRAGVRMLAHPLTVELAAADGRPGVEPLAGLTERVVRFGDVEVYYPGPGHAPDNIVVYARGVLFGGCLVKADDETSVGNVSDADIAVWPATVARVRAAFPRARLVIPGHGRMSGREALTHTESLIAEKGPAALEAYRRGRN